MHQLPNEPSSKHSPQEVEPLDEKVVRLTPRPRPTPESISEPPPDDDDDPGPSAA